MHLLSLSQANRLPDCGADPVASLTDMFVNRVQHPRILDGQCPARRPVFTKAHGSASATFEVSPDLLPEQRIGIFQYSQLAAWVRFSSDTKPGLGDFKTTIGLGIKLFDIPGTKLLEGDENALTADFLLQNHDVFFVDTAPDMCAFTYAGVVNHDYDAYLKEHETTARILNEMAKVEPSVATAIYWSGVPYAFGKRYVKYKVSPLDSHPLPPVPENNSSYLRDELKQRLLHEEVKFGFYLQFQTNHQDMPLDKATVRWDEGASVPQLFATLTLHRQDIDAPGQMAYAEHLSFNPWRTLEVHRPAGSISDARRIVYKAAADLRRNSNGVPVSEPGTARK